MSSLVDILRKSIKPGDVPTDERKRILAASLNKLGPREAKSVFSVIRSYKLSYDTVRRVGDSESEIPYYGVDTDEGIEMRLGPMPDELVLLLERLLLE
uniref:Uncharacterized protein n=1 Tax=viral metagenome TaxID=1070528 RepID=A0A6C0CGZ4_9ZZZZ